jgi:L-lysine 6-transaminase
MTTTATAPIAPADVHRLLARHMLADGLDLVFDYDKSHGSWLYDSRHGREYLDFMTFFGSTPIGYNHPKMKDPDFLRVLARVAQLKPSLADVYTVEYAWFVETFARIAIPSHLHYAFFIEGGALAVENTLKVAFDWKAGATARGAWPARRGQQILHFREAFHGRSGYTLSLTNTDPKKTDLFPKFRWPRVENPKLRFPVTAEVEKDVAAAEQRALEQVKKAFEDNPDDIAAIIIEPIQAEAATTTSGRRSCRPWSASRTTRVLLHRGRGADGHRPHREDVGARTFRPDPGRPRLRQEDADLRLPRRPQGGRGAAERVQGLLAHQLHLGRRPHRHGPLRPLPRDRPGGPPGRQRARGRGSPPARPSGVQADLGGIMSNARGRGLMIAFDLPTPELRKKAHETLIANGLLLLTCGPRSIRFRPPLNLTAAEADTALEIVRKSLKAL